MANPVHDHFREISRRDREADVSDYVLLMLTEDGYELASDLDDEVIHGLLVDASGAIWE